MAEFKATQPTSETNRQNDSLLNTNVTNGALSTQAANVQVVIFQAASFSLVRGYTRIIK